MKVSTTPFRMTILFAVLAFFSCGKDDATPSNAAFKGNFVSSAHTTSGVATIDQGESTLTLTNFKTDSGPDLNIYLASSINDITADYIDLGDIKGVNGTYTYDLLDDDYEVYKYVVVWCVDFDVNFGYAELIKQ